MLRLAPRISIIASNKKIILGVKIFLFKVFVQAKFMYGNIKAVGCFVMGLLARKREQKLAKRRRTCKKGAAPSAKRCEIQGSSGAHGPFCGFKHVFLSYLTFSMLLGLKQGGNPTNLKEAALPKGEKGFWMA